MNFAVIEHQSADLAGAAGCPDLARHLKAVRRYQRAEKDTRRLHRRLKRSNEGLVRTFRTIVDLLEEWGYVAGWGVDGEGYPAALCVQRDGSAADRVRRVRSVRRPRWATSRGPDLTVHL